MAKRPAYSNLCKAIEAGHFVFTGELEPKKILVPLFILAAAILILGIYPQLVLGLIEAATEQLQLIIP